MSKEQAKGFFEAISKDKQLADEVKEVVRGQATNQEKAKKLLSLAKRHNFNFTEDELKRSLSREDLAYIAGGSVLGQKIISGFLASTTGLGGAPVPLQLPVEQPAAIVQQAARNAQNQGETQYGNENEAPPAANEEEVNEIRELTPEEIAEHWRREEQERRELEERLAQGPLGLNEPAEDSKTTEDLFKDAKKRCSGNDKAKELVPWLERLEGIYSKGRIFMITSRLSSGHRPFDVEIKEWLRLICDPGKNINVSLQDILAEADFFIEQATEVTRSRLLAILPGTEHLAERMRNAQIEDEVQQRIIDFCENASAITSGANVSFEELQELLEVAYNLGEEATAIISSHFAPAPKPETADDENEVEEIRELTPEEIAERQRREEQRRRELEARLAQGPLELDESEPNWFENEDTNRLFREIEDMELQNRVNRLNTLYYRLLYAPQGQELMDRIRNYIATVGFTFDHGTESLQEQISISDALIHEAEEMLQQAEHLRGDELAEELRVEIQHGLDTLALILQRTHTGRPGEADLYTDVQTYLANRENYSLFECIARAEQLLERTYDFHGTLDLNDRLRVHDEYQLFSSRVWYGEGDEQAILEERLENNALPWLTQVGATLGGPGEHGLALEIMAFFDSLKDDFTYENLEGMNSLLDRARDMMMNRARAYTRFDTDQLHIRNNDLQLAQMLGIDKEYIQEKIKNKIKMSANDITGTIELPRGNTVTFNFMVGSGTLVLTGSGNTVIGKKYETISLFEQLEKSGIVFWAKDADDHPTNKQLPTPDSPFVVRNLIIGDGITKIDETAFISAFSLRSVYIMGPVQTIGYDAFFFNVNLIEVGFAHPEKLERIDYNAFSIDQRLVSINLPHNADINESAFSGCDQLKKQGCPYCVRPTSSSDEEIDSDTESLEDI